MDRCRSEVPPLGPAGEDPGHLSACWLPHDEAAREVVRKKVLAQVQQSEAQQAPAARAEA